MTDNRQDSYQAMLAAVQCFHDKHQLQARGGEDMPYRIALMAEELGEISACVTKGKSQNELAEECADLMILLIGTAISGNFNLDEAFWKKMDRLATRESRMIDGHVRVSEFKDT